MQWENVEITWTRQHGYTLRLPLWADERALALREDELIKAINAALSERSKIVSTISPMVVGTDPRASTAEKGEIAISTPSMLGLSEAQRLREGITKALDGVAEEAESVDAADNHKAAGVMAVLRGTDPPAPPAPN